MIKVRAKYVPSNIILSRSKRQRLVIAKDRDNVDEKYLCIGMIARSDLHCILSGSVSGL
jgi:hypothetical protein